MHEPSDVEIERLLLQLDMICDMLEQLGWPMQAAEAEQLYVNIHRRIGRPIPHVRAARLMQELAEVGQFRRRASDFP